MAEKKRIVLGSGILYAVPYEESMRNNLPEDAEIEKDENQLGAIQGGATLEYTMETYTATDDLGSVSKTVLVKEDALLKTGIITFNRETLKKLSKTARIDATTKKLKIGGIKNQSNKKLLIRFKQEDDVDGDLRVDIVGENTKGFSLAMVKDKETAVDVEFKASPDLDDEGTLFTYDDEPQTE